MTTLRIISSLLIFSTALTPTSFGEEAPDGFEARLFEPGVVSKPDRHEFGSVLSRDGNVVYFGVELGRRSEIWRALRRVEEDGEVGEWAPAKPFLSEPRHSFNDPFLDASETKLYFISNRTHPSKLGSVDTDIWFIEKSAGGWSVPQWLGQPVNSTAKEYFVSLTDDGTLYFASNVAAGPQDRENFDIYAAPPAPGGFAPPRRLGTGVNTGAYEADVFVAPNGSYLIFAATRKDGFGRGDLYISFRGEDGRFTRAVNMGKSVNTTGHELCPFVTRDGKTLLFTSREDIYAIDASIIERFR